MDVIAAGAVRVVPTNPWPPVPRWMVAMDAVTVVAERTLVVVATVVIVTAIVTV